MARLRNSWLPLLALAATAVISVILVSSDYEHGRDGPAIFPGIYPTTERFIPSLPELQVATAVVPAEPLAFREASDRRVGLEIVAWDELVIALEDHHPLTKSVAKALAEDLTGYLAAQGATAVTPVELASPLVAILPPDESAKLPLAMRRVLRVRTLAPTGPDFMDGPIVEQREAVVEIGQHDVVSPAVAERTGLMTAGSVDERHVRVRAEVAGADDETPWPRWHATVGRAIAATVLRDLFGGDVPPQPWDIAAQRAATVLARHHAVPDDAAMIWSDLPPNPPHANVDRWYGTFQLPLVRGWGGGIIGTEVPVVKKGVIKPTIEVLADVMGDEKWEPPERGEERWLWRAARPGGLEDTVAVAAPWGWRMSSFVRHPAVPAIAEAWLELAGGGESGARHQVRRHLLSPGLSTEWRDAAATLLRADPDAADLALLGLRDDASEHERAVAASVAWLRGVDGAAAPADWPPPIAGPWGGRPRLVPAGDGRAVIARDARDRLLVWWRHRDRPPRFGLGAEALAAAGVELQAAVER